MDCHLYSADRETMLGVIEVSFVKCNLPIHERTLSVILAVARTIH